MTVEFEQRIVQLDNAALEVGAWIPTMTANDHPPVVILHDGLGVFALWDDIPARIASRLATPVVAINRSGHGGSTPVPDRAWPADWLHRQADLLGRLLGDDLLGVGTSVHLVGHSDGGSIALLCAVSNPESVARVTTLAAHSWVEPKCADEIRRMRADPQRLLRGLARVHAAPQKIFEAWSGVWVSDEFADWDIRPLLRDITAPVMIVQGNADEYATDAMVWETVAAIGPNARGIAPPRWPHLMNRSHPDELVDLLTGWDR